jgi:integrase/recombinase XerD
VLAGQKRFILAGGDVFTLQKLLGHTTLAMVRRYVELGDVDVKTQH